MFKKFKDKLAEEVKSSPQRIQQFAQAAQAAVTSASSSVSDITNNDLFSIGDNDVSTKSQPSTQQNVMPPSTSSVPTTSDFSDFSLNYEDKQRQRRLSNSSLASDISFRLPNYESPSMYHLQSDMEISASEAEDRGFGGGTVYLDRVTKEQLYAAYKRTQDKFKKYKSQYSDLARHYKLLERENAKARNVLVETQDKALRRVSELKEQCTLEQSAKAHLEKALRVEIDEKQMKIDALDTQLKLLQQNNQDENNTQENVQLINLNDESETKEKEEQASEVTVLNNKVEKLEQLLSKYKESLKATKEKNANMTVEIQKLTTDLETKTKECNQLQTNIETMSESKRQVQELLEKIETLENVNNSLEFKKNKEISIFEANMQSALEEISELQKKVQILSKREEEYAISLAENKLSIHKELESKETEIKSLKDALTSSQSDVESLNKDIKEYKNEILKLQSDKSEMSNKVRELNAALEKSDTLHKDIQKLNDKIKSLENGKLKFDEDMNCLNLQLKQETAEKLSVIDRNVYLENRNSQLTEEIEKKRMQINKLDNEISVLRNNIEELKLALEENQQDNIESNQVRLAEEATAWKLKCSSLESEIQEERIELGKLQTEIEKLLSNHEMLQNQNQELNITLDKMRFENITLNQEIDQWKKIQIKLTDVKKKLFDMHKFIGNTSKEVKSLKDNVLQDWLPQLKENILLLQDSNQFDITNNNGLKEQIAKISEEYKVLTRNADNLKQENIKLKENFKQKISECEDLTTSLANQNKEHQRELLNMKNIIIDLEKCKEDAIQAEDNLKKTVTLLTDELDMLKKENQSMTSEIQTLTQKSNKIAEVEQEYTNKLRYITELEDKFKIINEENAHLKSQQSDMCDKNVQLQSDLSKMSAITDDISSKLKNVEKENENLKIAYTKNENNNKTTESELFELRKIRDELESEIKSIKQEYDEIKLSKSQIEQKCNDIKVEIQETRALKDEQEKKLQALTEIYENLNSSYVEVNNRLETTEKQLLEIQNNNSEIIKERDNLVKIVEKLEKDLENQSQILEDRKDNNNELDILKEENRRLCSDIEGLQTYLTKISKENSDLNDKIRELIASSDNASEGNDYIRNEIQMGKEKIDELLRENSILIEENLELKDQIQSQINSTNANNIQTHATKNTDGEINDIRDKYHALLESKNKLESKVNELEQMNMSLNKNVDHTQVNYERLKLSNEKLQRKLDEALVSLRHLHALEENTELEYLKNILFEYLTGSGTHSITLAKVLAAVVKFDARQTEQVLQKEKERQGFLRQLGII